MTALAATWLTPFGVPFDTAVLAGLVLTVLTILLTIRGPRRDDTADPGREDER